MLINNSASDLHTAQLNGCFLKNGYLWMGTSYGGEHNVVNAVNAANAVNGVLSFNSYPINSIKLAT